jgi:predicted RNA-binding Zn ribbon-like protein
MVPTTFQLIAADPTLDFVNTLDNRFAGPGPVELLDGYEDLLRFVEQAGLVEAKSIAALARSKNSAAAARSFASALGLREALASLLYGQLASARPPEAKTLETLERHFLDAEAHTELVWKPPTSDQTASALDWEWGRFEKDPALPVWALAQFAARLLTSPAMARVRMCECDTCRWLFLDTSKNHTRRWCDMKICGNRMKARRFIARRQTQAGMPQHQVAKQVGGMGASQKSRKQQGSRRQPDNGFR